MSWIKKASIKEVDQKSLDQKIRDAESLIAAELAKTGAPCVTSSFQTECVVLVHMIRKQRPDIPVLFLETGYHFPETLAYRDQMTRDWNLNLINLEAKQSVADQESQFGILNQTEPSKCCALRKVESAVCGDRASTTFGSRRCGASNRRRARICKQVEPFKLPAGEVLEKVSPLAAWTNQRCVAAI